MTENINQKDTQVTESTETTVSETGSGSASQTTERATGGRVDIGERAGLGTLATHRHRDRAGRRHRVGIEADLTLRGGRQGETREQQRQQHALQRERSEHVDSRRTDGATCEGRPGP